VLAEIALDLAGLLGLEPRALACFAFARRSAFSCGTGLVFSPCLAFGRGFAAFSRGSSFVFGFCRGLVFSLGSGVVLSGLRGFFVSVLVMALSSFPVFVVSSLAAFPGEPDLSSMFFVWPAALPGSVPKEQEAPTAKMTG
jgi:Na+-transporting NADH:ubiquinone oxidoreductase subunit NqrD